MSEISDRVMNLLEFDRRLSSWLQKCFDIAMIVLDVYSLFPFVMVLYALVTGNYSIDSWTYYSPAE